MIRLFLSTDVAGSTLYKTGFARNGEAGWLGVFRDFFVRYPVMVVGQVGMEFLEEDALPEIAVWKFMGDEAIFTATPSSPEEVTLLVRAHYNAMAAYEREYLADTPLRLKGTAWLARFPSPNIEIEVPELAQREGTAQTDFLGPDIDLGFRIAKFACPSTVTVSLDLLDVVLRAKNHELLDFFLVGRQELKGVLFGRPYPAIWACPAGASPGFMPWEVEDSPMAARARRWSRRARAPRRHDRQRPPLSAQDARRLPRTAELRRRRVARLHLDERRRRLHSAVVPAKAGTHSADEFLAPQLR